VYPYRSISGALLFSSAAETNGSFESKFQADHGQHYLFVKADSERVETV
jgi:hypothetical protein